MTIHGILCKSRGQIVGLLGRPFGKLKQQRDTGLAQMENLIFTPKESSTFPLFCWRNTKCKSLRRATRKSLPNF